MDELLAHFKADDLSGTAPRKVARVCADLAQIAAKLPPSTELVAGLRKLLEARELLVRAAQADIAAAAEARG